MSWAVYASLGLGLLAALVGGVFQSFSDFVMRGLVLAEPAGGMESMQQLNRTVFRSAFLATFLALVPATGAFAIYAGVSLSGAPRALIIASAVVYALLVFAVTAGGNVPMNEQLDRLAHSSAEGHAYWATYGRVWTRWNHLRTLGSVVTAVCLLFAAVQLASGPSDVGAASHVEGRPSGHGGKGHRRSATRDAARSLHPVLHRQRLEEGRGPER